MAIITISRGSYSKGRDIAEKVAERLGYECVSRDVLLEASSEFRIPEVKLVRALHDAPSVLDRFTHGKARYVAYVQKALLAHVQKDNVVYHGLAGHFFLKDIQHVLKVRVIADLHDRVRWEMERDNISRDKALHLLTKDDKERRAWSLTLYGIDTADPSLYDLVIHIGKVAVDDAVEIICRSARLPHFQTTVESQRALDKLLLGAQVKDAIVAKWPESSVRELMIPVSQCMTISVGASALEAVMELSKALAGSGDKPDKRSVILVRDEMGEIVGRLSELSVLRGLDPGHADKLHGKTLRHFGLGDGFINSMAAQYDFWDRPIADLCTRAAGHTARDVMCPVSEDESIEESASLQEGMHQLSARRHHSLFVTKDGRVVGVLGVLEVFAAVGQAMTAVESARGTESE